MARIMRLEGRKGADQTLRGRMLSHNLAKIEKLAPFPGQAQFRIQRLLLGNAEEHGQTTLNLHQCININASEG